SQSGRIPKKRSRFCAFFTDAQYSGFCTNNTYTKSQPSAQARLSLQKDGSNTTNCKIRALCFHFLLGMPTTPLSGYE
ncbi:MAG: hypothetical protein II370_08005, partial [Clostridia bacterium]|nr:hypothetical protein [Clostridia bacterium]